MTLDLAATLAPFLDPVAAAIVAGGTVVALPAVPDTIGRILHTLGKQTQLAALGTGRPAKWLSVLKVQPWEM